MGRRTLYLIRHARYFETSPGPGRSAGGLTPEGAAQARRTAARMKRIPFHVIHCSTLRRAMETMEIIHRVRSRARIRKAHMLRESIPCVPRRSPELFRGIRAAAIARDRSRAERVFRRYFKTSRGGDRSELVVTHGNLIRYLICRVLGVSPRVWLNMRIHNCGVSVVVVKEDGNLVLASYNDTGHLPARLLT